MFMDHLIVEKLEMWKMEKSEKVEKCGAGRIHIHILVSRLYFTRIL